MSALSSAILSAVRARKFLLGLVGIAALALVIRLWFVTRISPTNGIGGDARTYHDLANLLAEGHGFVESQLLIKEGIRSPTAEHPPLYPLLLAAVSELGGTSWGAHRGASAVMGTGTVAAVGLLGRRAGSAATGLVAAALAAVYPPIMIVDGTVYSESLYGLTIALALIAAYRLLDRPTAGRAALLGAVIGLAALTRSEGLLLVPLLALPVAWRAGEAVRRNAAVAVAAFVLVVSPWVVRSWIAFDRPVGLSTNLGTMLGGANCPETYGGVHAALWRHSCLRRASGDEAARAAAWRAQGIEYAAEHPDRLAVIAPLRVMRAWDLWRPLQGVDYVSYLEGRDLEWQRAGLYAYYALLAAAVGGAAVLWRRRQPLLILLAPVVLVTVTTAVAYGISRLRMAAEISLVVLASVALVALVELGVRRRREARGVAG